jgi:predicted DNA-binding transcriptional regulator AlpA
MAPAAEYISRPDDDDLVDPPEAARILSISKRTLYNWKVDGRGPKYVKVGHLTRYRKGDLRRYVHEHTSGGF